MTKIEQFCSVDYLKSYNRPKETEPLASWLQCKTVILWVAVKQIDYFFILFYLFCPIKKKNKVYININNNVTVSEEAKTKAEMKILIFKYFLFYCQTTTIQVMN